MNGTHHAAAEMAAELAAGERTVAATIVPAGSLAARLIDAVFSGRLARTRTVAVRWLPGKARNELVLAIDESDAMRTGTRTGTRVTLSTDIDFDGRRYQRRRRITGFLASGGRAELLAVTTADPS